MTVSYKLCGGDGTTLVATSDGKLVLASARDTAATLAVYGVNPTRESAENQTGWYTAWKVTIGGGTGVYGGASHSGTSGGNTNTRTYTGPIDSQHPTIEVLLQLMAWSGTTPPNEGVAASDIGWHLVFTAAGVSEERYGQFNANVTSPKDQSGDHLDENVGYIRILGTFDFANRTWNFTTAANPQQGGNP